MISVHWVLLLQSAGFDAQMMTALAVNSTDKQISVSITQCLGTVSPSAGGCGFWRRGGLFEFAFNKGFHSLKTKSDLK